MHILAHSYDRLQRVFGNRFVLYLGEEAHSDALKHERQQVQIVDRSERKKTEKSRVVGNNGRSAYEPEARLPATGKTNRSCSSSPKLETAWYARETSRRSGWKFKRPLKFVFFDRRTGEYTKVGGKRNSQTNLPCNDAHRVLSESLQTETKRKWKFTRSRRQERKNKNIPMELRRKRDLRGILVIATNERKKVSERCTSRTDEVVCQFRGNDRWTKRFVSRYESSFLSLDLRVRSQGHDKSAKLAYKRGNAKFYLRISNSFYLPFVSTTRSTRPSLVRSLSLYIYSDGHVFYWQTKIIENSTESLENRSLIDRKISIPFRVKWISDFPPINLLCVYARTTWSVPSAIRSYDTFDFHQIHRNDQFR